MTTPQLSLIPFSSDGKEMLIVQLSTPGSTHKSEFLIERLAFEKLINDLAEYLKKISTPVAPPPFYSSTSPNPEA